MTAQEIAFIGYQELGAEGELVARNTSALRSILKRRLTKTSIWKTKTGFSSIINLIRGQMVNEVSNLFRYYNNSIYNFALDKSRCLS
jgi:hypothetical protein